MEQIFFSVLHMSLITSYVIICLLIVRFLMKKAPKIFSYLLWSVVFLRLVCPFSFESNISLIPKQVSKQAIETTVFQNINTAGNINNNAVNQPNILNEDSALKHSKGGIKATPSRTFILSVIWLSVAIILAGYNSLSILRLKHKLGSARHIEKNLYEAKNIRTPFVLGIIKPQIYIPIDILETEKNYIIRHEQIHIQRRDYLIKYAAFLITCIHWFNPLIWIAFILMSRDMEMSCDERVLKEFGNQIKKEYSSSLLSHAIDKKIIIGTPLAFGKNATKDRIRNVLQYKKPTIIKIILSLLVVILTFGGLLVNPSEAKRENYNYKGKNQPLALTDFAIAKTQTTLKDDTRAEDAEFIRRLNSITSVDLKNAKRVSEDGWEAGLCLLAELPDDDIHMYGYNDDDYQFRGIIIRIGNKLNYFDWTYSSPDMNKHQMYYYDLDNDGRKELAVTIYFGGGTGYSITNLFILEQNDAGTLEAYQFKPEDYVAQINQKITYKVNREKKVIALYDGKHKLREADLTWLPEDAEVKGVYYGNIIQFDLGKQLIMRIGPGMKIDDWASLQYDGLDDLQAIINYKDRVFHLTTIK